MPRKASKSTSGPAQYLTPETTVVSSRLLTTLWASYGTITSLTATHPTLPNPTPLILKTISPPRGSSTDESHLRKLISYHVERFFYSTLSTHLPLTVKVAQSYPSLLAPTSLTSNTVLLLEDLGPAGFPLDAGGYLSQPHAIRAVLTWLAEFHSTFMDPTILASLRLIPPPLEADLANIDNGVWENGSYWYLATRRDEYDDFLASGEYEWLEPWVKDVDAALHSPTARGRTILHGDPKAANIRLNPSGTAAALYDFQYCGAGLGVVDLVYFLGTSVASRVMEKGGDEELIGFYAELVEEKSAGRVSKEEVRVQLEWAFVDWMRFMGGWGVWGNGRWVERRAREACRNWEERGWCRKEGLRDGGRG